MTTTPLISIVTPVFNPPLWALEECITSVTCQTYQNWQWCIADDCSTDPAVRHRLAELAAKEPRVTLSLREANGGIVEASNTALSTVRGEYVVLLDHDDSLTTDALDEIVQAFTIDTEVDYVYSDEDKVGPSGEFFDLFSKPCFSPERLRAQNYCCHVSAFRTSILEAVGGFRQGMDGAQDWDLILRVTERARKVSHIPKVLYHWRVIPGSTAGGSDAKPYVFEAGRKAVAEHCERTGISASVSVLPNGYVRCHRRPASDPLVSIIIPTRGDRKRVWGIETCLAANAISSVLERSSWSKVELILVHDRVPALDREIQELSTRENVRVVWYDKEFDFSDKCNTGALHANGEVLLFLNDDTEVISPDWVETLIAHFDDPEVGMVGPLLVLEDGRIQSAGHSNNPSPYNLGSGELIQDPGPFGERSIAREVSGVTGACLSMRAADYFALGGMSLDFPHSFNDVDLALKVLQTGKRIIWTPYARLWHFESLTRDPTVRSEEYQTLYDRWESVLGHDSYSR